MCLAGPITYFCSAGMGRLAWLNRMKKEGRLGVVLGPAVKPGQVQLVWILVFKNLGGKGRLTRRMGDRLMSSYAELPDCDS